MTTAGGMDGSGKHYDEVAIGEAFRRALTVTDAHLVLGAGLIGDFNPHHVDGEYAAKSRFGTRILHGMMTSAMIALLEHASRFTAPVRPGDTVATTWTVAELADKPKHGGGIVTLKAVASNQRGEVVAEGDAKMLVHATAAWLAARGGAPAS